MSKLKKLFVIILTLALVFNTFAIGASAVMNDGNMLSVDINLEVGTVSKGVFTPLDAGAALHTGDIITVRICPANDFYCGASRYVVMYSSAYLSVVGTGKGAFTVNTANTFYTAVASDYSAATTIPSNAWPASMLSLFDTYKAVAVNNNANSNSGNGGYPDFMPGDWLFSFKLTVTQDITPDSGARIWMDSRWFKSPVNLTGAAYFAKCTSADQLSTLGSSTIYYFDIDLAGADLNLEPFSTVTFFPNAGTWEGGIQDSKTFASEAPYELPALTRAGYTFAGWSPAIPATPWEGNFKTYAQWTVNQTTIDFNVNGGSAVTAITGDIGSPVPAITAPVKPGYTFAGWNPQIPAAFPAENITCTAQWVIPTVCVTFDANGGIGGTGYCGHPGEPIIVPTVSRPGYTFAGWSPAVPANLPAEDATYTAQWHVNSYTVIFDANGGIGGTIGEMAYGSALIPPIVTRTGYTFAGWAPDVPATVPAEDTTYTAQWQINTYNAVFMVDGTIYQTVPTVYGAQINAPANPAKAGYDFVGWSPSVGTIGAADMTFHAMFVPKIIEYIAHYVVDGNYYRDVAVPAGSTVPPDPSVVMPEMAAPAKPGYTLIGWSAPLIMPEHDIIVSALWSRNEVTITIDWGDTIENLTGYPGDTVSLAMRTKTGFTFMGFSPAIPATFPSSDLSVTAHWIVNKYNAYFMVDNSLYETVPTDYHTQIQAPSNPQKEGFAFTGWAPAVGLMGDMDKTFTALFNINTYSAVFMVDGTIYQTIPTVFGSAITVPAAPAKPGFTFAGWDTVPAAMPANEVIISALWNRIPVTLSAKAGSTTTIDEAKGVITGLEEGMTIEAFLRSFIAMGGDGRIDYHYLDNSFGTHTRIDLVDNVTGLIIKTYYIIIFGDINGDGSIDSLDAGTAVDYENYVIAWDAPTDGVLPVAGDLNGDGEIDSLDAGIMVDAENYLVTIDQTTGLAD